MRLTTGSVLSAFVLLMTASADVQAQGFIGGGGGTSFDPQISVVNSGTVLDVAATVSADRKYVTLTMRPQLASLIALREFVFQNGSGVVGMQTPGGGGGNGNGVGNNANNGRATTPRGPLMPALVRPPEPTPVLLQEGMQRVDQPAATGQPAAVSPAAARSPKPGK